MLLLPWTYLTLNPSPKDMEATSRIRKIITYDIQSSSRFKPFDLLYIVRVIDLYGFIAAISMIQYTSVYLQKSATYQDTRPL